MAHFAKLDETDTVLEVIVVDDNWLKDDNGIESETKGIAALHAWSGHPRWVQTSYNNRIRVRYAGVGYKFDRVRNAFISPKPHPSWIFDETTVSWVSPDFTAADIPEIQINKPVGMTEDGKTWN
jgi:hypothetical protein